MLGDVLALPFFDDVWWNFAEFEWMDVKKAAKEFGERPFPLSSAKRILLLLFKCTGRIATKTLPACRDF